MSTDLERIEQSYQSPTSADLPEQYRALSTAAVAALVFGLLSLTALLDTWLIVVPAVGIVWGIIALRQIRARPSELTGTGMAICGLALSSVLAFAGPAWVYYDDLRQIPPGYEPISYEDLQPNPKVLGEIVPGSKISEIKDKKVYIKGFVLAGSQSDGIKQFVLVRDPGTCCFGGNPKLTDKIIVNLASPGGMVYMKQVARVSGVFRFNPIQGPDGSMIAFYHLDQAEMR